MLPHQRFVAQARRGQQRRPAYRAPLAPYTNWLTMLFLVGVLVLVALDYPLGTWTLASMGVVIPVLIIGWFAVRGRVRRLAAKREGFTGAYPVIVQTPGTEDQGTISTLP